MGKCLHTMWKSGTCHEEDYQVTPGWKSVMNWSIVIGKAIHVLSRLEMKVSVGPHLKALILKLQRSFMIVNIWEIDDQRFTVSWKWLNFSQSEEALVQHMENFLIFNVAFQILKKVIWCLMIDRGNSNSMRNMKINY